MESLIEEAFISRGIAGYIRDKKMTIPWPKAHLESKYLRGDQDRNKNEYEFIQKVHRWFLLKKTGFKRMTELKF